jgi:hypothetical protein
MSTNLFRSPVSSVKYAFVLILGVAIGYALNWQTPPLRIDDAPRVSSAAPAVDKVLPLGSATPAYVIEPPDILRIT